jgi:hypothetical protein
MFSHKTAETLDPASTEKRREEQTREEEIRGPIAELEQVVRGARAALVRGYRDRYEAAAKDAWMGEAKARSDIDTCARWCIAKGPQHTEERATKLLDGVFADEALTRASWPWAWVAKDPGRYARPVPAPKAAARTAFVDVGKNFAGFNKPASGG